MGKKALFLGLLLLFVFTTPSFAHSYHYEIQVVSDLQSQNEELSALKMTWFYDEDVSSAMLQDQEDLTLLSKKLIDDLDLLGYFTQLKLDGKVILVGKAKEVQLQKDKNALTLSFVLPLSMKAKVKSGSVLSFDHEDPSGVAILYYDKKSHILMNNILKKRCKSSVANKKKRIDGEFPQVVKIEC